MVISLHSPVLRVPYSEILLNLSQTIAAAVPLNKRSFRNPINPSSHLSRNLITTLLSLVTLPIIWIFLAKT